MSSRARRAQAAYANRDTELSRAVHQSTELAELAAGKSDFLHGSPPSSNFISSFVSTYLRGSVTCTFLTACLVGVPPQVSGVVWLVGIAISTAVSFFAVWMDDRMMTDFTDFERQRERWEVDNFPEGEIQEMIQIYSEYGVSESDSMLVARTLSKYPEFWVEHMLLHEIGIVPKKIDKDRDDSSLRTKVRNVLFGFYGPFLVPAVFSFLGWTGWYVWLISVIQSVVVLHFKRTRSQWLPFSSLAGIGMVLTLASAALAQITTFIAAY
jgi:hypothetical protein